MASPNAPNSALGDRERGGVVIGARIRLDLIAYTHGGSEPVSLEAMLEMISAWNAAFETHFSVPEQVAEGDKVASRVTVHAIHSRGAFQGLPPTGKQDVTDSVSIERIKDGKIVERRVISDWYATMEQLGLVPAAQPAK